MSSHFLAPSMSYAADPPPPSVQYFEFKRQKVYYENAEYKEIVDAATGETLPVLIFRQDGWFKSSKTATGRALVVGGGGAGGYGTTGGTNPGGGGGGKVGCWRALDFIWSFLLPFTLIGRCVCIRKAGGGEGKKKHI